MQSLSTYTRDQLAALLPSLVRMLLAAFLEAVTVRESSDD